MLNIIGARGDLYAYLKDIELLITTWLKDRFPHILADMQTDNANYHGARPDYIDDDEEYIAPRIVFSWQLGNEPHVDPKDNGVSVVVWVVSLNDTDLDEVPSDWRFILQNLRTNVDGVQRDGVLIQLFHGIVIVYDGKRIRHATSVPLDERYTRYGIFHGSTNPRGYKKYAPKDGNA